MVSYDNAVKPKSSDLQKFVSLSSTEAGYVTLSDARRTITCLQRLLRRLHAVQRPIKVLRENAGTVK